MINYCQAVGNSKGALSSDAHLSSSFMDTRPHKVLHCDSGFSTRVQSGCLLQNFRVECYLPFFLSGRCNLGQDSDILVDNFSYKGSKSSPLPSLLSFMPSQSITLDPLPLLSPANISSLVTQLIGLDYYPTHLLTNIPLILANPPILQSRQLFIKYGFYFGPHVLKTLLLFPLFS